MIDSIVRIPNEDVRAIKWQGDALYYDLQLFELGSDLAEFWVANPEHSHKNLHRWIEHIPDTRKCIVFTHNGDWIVKLFKEGWYPYHGYETVELNIPTIVWKRNPEIDSLMKFVKEPTLTYFPDPNDLSYELVWNLDPRFLPDETPVWIYRASFVGDKVKRQRIKGQVVPEVSVVLNQDLPEFNLDIDSLYPPYHDLDHENLYMLDRKHCPANPVWVVKFLPKYRAPKGKIYVGTILPEVITEHNEVIQADFEDPAKDFDIPYHDFMYTHVWYIEYQGEKIWASKTWVGTPTKIKDMGMIEYENNTKFDVVFISYNEPNAEKNWQRVLEKCPTAKRVDGVKGIFNAHKKAAKIATTDMFYVVDGDAWLTDTWEFNFDPGLFDRDCAYVWHSKNPVNDLEYGYGGVKLFPRKEILKVSKWKTLDMYSGVTAKKKVVPEVSCLTSFNSDEFSTWRSAFRESVKLYLDNNTEHLDIWMSRGADRLFGEYSIKGAVDGYEFAKKYSSQPESLSKINNYGWLRKKFDVSNAADK